MANDILWAMTRLLVLAHAPLASALRAVAAHVDADAARDLTALDVPADWPVDRIDLALGAAMPPHEPVLVLCDVFGASPCNAALRMAACRPMGLTQVICGVNVAMVWRAMTYRHEPLTPLARRVLEGGQQGIMPLVVLA